MERTNELGTVTTARQSGTKTANFLLRPGEGREFLGKALSGHAASLMLKKILNTLPTKQILHIWFTTEHTKATCELCGKENETIDRPFWISTARNRKNPRQPPMIKRVDALSKALEKALVHSPDRCSPLGKATRPSVP